MAHKTQSKPSASADMPANPFAQRQEAGLGNLAGLNNTWFEAIGDIGAEVMSFVAERIREDVKTQHKMMHCKSAADLQHVQAQFIQKAIDQYQAETGKLLEMSTNAFSSKPATEKS